MLIKPSRWEQATDPRGKSRYTCPYCGAGSVVHLVPGEPTRTADGTPEASWVQRTGDVEIDRNRWCGACGESWTQVEVPTRVSFTIRDARGAAVTLAPVPRLSLGAGPCVDITLTCPGRLVRILGRRLGPDSLRRLAELLDRAAQSESSEHEVLRLVDDVAGWRFTLRWATEDGVDLSVKVDGDMAGPGSETDRLELALTRTALRAAADHAGWQLR